MRQWIKSYILTDSRLAGFENNVSIEQCHYTAEMFLKAGFLTKGGCTIAVKAKLSVDIGLLL